MKKVILAGLFYFLAFFSKAQTGELDREKLFDFYQNQRYAEAASYLKSLYPGDISDVKILSQIAYSYMMSSNLPDAEKTYEQINQLQPNTIGTLFNLANINMRRGVRTKTVAYLQQILTIDSNNFNAYKQLANYLDSLPLKLKCLEKANSINPAEGDVAYDLADLYKTEKAYEKGYNVLQKAISADTGNFILQEALLPLAIQLKKYKEVISIGEKLLSNEASPNVIRDVGKAYFFLKDYEKCIFYYNVLKKFNAQNENILYFMALSYRELKKYDLAITYAKKTIDEAISPNTAFYYNTLGNIYENKNQLTNAMTSFKRGLTFSNEKDILYSMAVLYDTKLNQPANALNYYKQYLKNKELKEIDKAQVDYAKQRVELLSAPHKQ
ncbi:tetratricopeptide repeat protein [Pedobacter montanisoli]|uniref:Tetratricopeptide repeat protein n=1 Tax=Pedobacter montanisoli TaxID=2923277 RepID=A0ABS9ZRX1_9SPHI|nr:tetratricopeptide repeat protein [Pedobacter montanisoli]MCJ0741088.1 tetratricopeptide repeat protein [Pedobacter montanisoli]